MFIPVRLSAAPILLATLLAACAGGGGGGGSGAVGPAPVPTEVAFTSFDAVRPNQTVVMSGISQTGSGTATAFNLDPVDGTSSARLTFDGQGNLWQLGLNTPGSSMFYGPGDVIVCRDGSCGASNATSRAVLVDPYVLGWNYQSFGVWMDDINPTTFNAGALSAGAVTPGSAVPTTSTATFTGHAGGFYFDGQGGQYATDARMSAVTNFSTRSIQFSTTDTLVTDMANIHGAATPNAALNLSGTLNYAAGSSRFSGDVQTQSLGLTGKADGQFYGPSAQEIGGVYGLKSPTGASMVGGFGGKR